MAEIAVLLATYRGETYLAEQIESLLAQTFQDFVIYIHDDGSPDHTREVIEQYAQKYPERIVPLTYGSTGGAAANFLSMMRDRTERYLMFCDQDDFWMPDKIQVSYEAMQKLEAGQPEVPCLTFTDLKVVDEKLNVMHESFMTFTRRDPSRLQFCQLLVQNMAPGCTMMVNQALAAYMLRCPDAKTILMHDWWGMVLAAVYGRIQYLDRPTILYRQHTQNVVGATDRSIPGRIRYCVNAVREGTYVRAKREGMQNLIALAAAAEDAGQPAPEKKAVLEGIRRFPEMSKLQRIRFCRKHNISSYQRNWWFLCWV